MAGAGHHDHGGHAHSHDHGPGPDTHGRGSRWRHVLRPHSHDHAGSLDEQLLADRDGQRALAISLVGLLITAALQGAVFAFSASVGLLADTIHNLADALTALPIGLAFWVARRPGNRRYTYGYGRAEDLAGLFVILVMAVSAGVAAWQAVDRLIHPRHVGDLGWVAAAGVVGFAGNELAARYRIRVGTRIGSAALVADGRHARTDGFTSLAVVIGALGVGLGWRDADPVVGLAITVSILAVLRGAVRDIYRRLMDAVDPELVEQIERLTLTIPDISGCDRIRVRWIGHQLHAQLNITVDGDLTVTAAHHLTELSQHHLLHHIPRLTGVTIHVNPPDHAAAHALTSHHDEAG